jgi:hypothetical protein
MQRGHKNISQLARELEPLPVAWSEMSIRDALHLLHLSETAPMTASGLREALENALERAKFDEIPVLLGAYRMLEGHYGAPEGAGTRQDDPTCASWPMGSGTAVSTLATDLDPWEDDPSITVSDIRMIEPALETSSTQASSAPWFAKTDTTDLQRIVIDDFGPGQPDLLHVQASHVRRAAHVVRMQPINSPPRAKFGLSIPGLLAVGIAGLLVLWAYHPSAQGLVATVLGQTTQPQTLLATPTPITQPEKRPGKATAEAVIKAESAVVSSAPVIERAPEVQVPAALPKAKNIDQASTMNGGPVSGQPVSGQPVSSVTSSKVIGTGAVQLTTKPPQKPKLAPVGKQVRKTQATASKPNIGKVTTKKSSTTSRATKPQPIINAATAQKALQVVKNAVTRVPTTTQAKPLRVSNQASRTSKNNTTNNPSLAKAAPKRAVPKTVSPKTAVPKTAAPKTASAKPDTSITNPIKLASSNERDVAAARAIANPQPVSSIQVPKASGKIDNLSREEFGQRYFNRKLFEVWQRDSAKLRYGTWDEIPLELQILENNLFRSAIYLNGPSRSEAKDNEKPVQP